METSEESMNADTQNGNSAEDQSTMTAVRKFLFERTFDDVMPEVVEEQEPEEEGGAAPSDMFSRLDTDGDGVVSREEFEFAMGGPTLTGQVSGFETQDGTWSEGPGGQPSKKISNTTQFFLGLIGGPVGIFIVGWIFIVLGEVTGEYDAFASISLFSSAGLVIGGTA